MPNSFSFQQTTNEGGFVLEKPDKRVEQARELVQQGLK